MVTKGLLFVLTICFVIITIAIVYRLVVDGSISIGYETSTVSLNPSNSQIKNDASNNNSERGKSLVIKIDSLSTVPSGFYNRLEALNAYLISFEIQNNTTQRLQLKFQTVLNGFTEAASNSTSLDPGKQITINQTPLLLNEKGIESTIQASLHYEIWINDKLYEEKSKKVVLLSKDTMVWSLASKGGDYLDTSVLISSWVTPDVNYIKSLLRAATSYHPDKGFDGYQCPKCKSIKTKRKNVNDQAKAIYQMLKEHVGLRYINQPFSFSINQEVYQKVNQPIFSLEHKQGNCIDLSVLFASFLEAIGIESYIIIIPGHAFVGWRVVQRQDQQVAFGKAAFERFNQDYTQLVSFLENLEFLDIAGITHYTFERAIQEGWNYIKSSYQNGLLKGDFSTDRAKIINVSLFRNLTLHY